MVRALQEHHQRKRHGRERSAAHDPKRAKEDQKKDEA